MPVERFERYYGAVFIVYVGGSYLLSIMVTLGSRLTMYVYLGRDIFHSIDSKVVKTAGVLWHFHPNGTSIAVGTAPVHWVLCGPPYCLPQDSGRLSLIPWSDRSGSGHESRCRSWDCWTKAGNLRRQTLGKVVYETKVFRIWVGGGSRWEFFASIDISSSCYRALHLPNDCYARIVFKSANVIVLSNRQRLILVYLAYPFKLTWLIPKTFIKITMTNCFGNVLPKVIFYIC